MIKKIAISGASVFALITAACGDSSHGTGFGASAGESTGPGTSATTITTGDPPTTSSSMSDGSGQSGTGTASATGTTGGTGEPGTGSASSTSDGTGGPGTTGGTTGMASSEPGSSGPGMTTGTGEKMPCQVEETQVKPIPPSVLFILDKSGSMSMEQWDHDANPQTPDVTRWYSLYKVVEGVVKTFNTVVNFGVKLYPKIDAGSYVDVGACVVNPGVEVPIAPLNATKVLQGIPAAEFMVLGGTPMETGLKEGFKYLKTLDPGLQRFAIMVADGEISDTCKGENFLEAQAAVEDAFNLFDIPTYVVGIDVDPSTSEQLATLAVAGGKPKQGIDPFYQTTNQIELQSAIQQIIDDTLSCVIAVDPEPAEPDLFEVWIGGVKIDPANSCDQNGWIWTKPHSEIELCGDACKSLKKTGKVETLYFCTPG